jgi:hypothetical protein
MSPSPGEISGTPTAVGKFNFTIMAADAFGDSNTQSYLIVVSAAVPPLTFAAIPAETYGNAPFTVSASSASSGAVTYSMTSGPATIADSTVTLTGAGTVVLSASQAASGNYAAATGSATFTVGKATAAINVTPYNVIYDGNAHTATGTATGVGGANLNADLTLSGTNHTNAGSYATDPWSFSDATGNYASASGTVSDQISAETVSLNFASIPTHTYGDAQFTVSATSVSGGAVTYSVTCGPATVNATTGLVTLTPPGAAPAIMVLSASQAASGNYAVSTTSTSFTVDPALSITTTSPLPTGVVRTAYSQPLQATGGTGSYTWSLVSGGTQLAGLGLTFNPGAAGVGATASVTSSSAILGGPVSFTVQVSDNASPAHTVQATFTVTVSSYSITTTTLSPNYVYTGSIYSATINALGGTSPYTWTVFSGGSALTAAGLSLSTGTGLSNTIFGNVPSGATTGPINFTVKVVDANGISITQAYLLTVYGALSLTTPDTTVPGPAVIGQSYTGNNIFASGGNGSYSWAVTGLTSGLTYNTTGNPLVISGTPPTTSQTINASVTLTDTTTGKTLGPAVYNIVVALLTPLTLPASNPTSLPSATINQQYNGAINASGGSGSGYVWSINGTAVPTDETTSVPKTGHADYGNLLKLSDSK